MIFQNREQAGQQLAEKLLAYRGRTDVIVLAIPRGGVPVAFEVARILKAPLDIFLSRKLGVPGQEELAFGALASGGVRVLDRDLISELNLSRKEIDRIAENVERELERREQVYRGNRSPIRIEGKVALLVDDGIATGSSMRAAIKALRQMKPSRLVVAVPVASLQACQKLRSEVDELVCVYAPEYFYAIGQFYEDFSQITDETVSDLLRGAVESAGSSRPGSASAAAGDKSSRKSEPAGDALNEIRTGRRGLE